MKTNRRSFLRMTGAAGAAALVLKDNSIELVAQASRALGANRSLVAGAALTGFAAGGPARPEAAALFGALGEPAAPARVALDLLMAREAAPVALAEAQGIAHFGPGEAAAHAEASRRAIAELRGSG